MNNKINANNYLCEHCGLLVANWRHRCQWLFCYCRGCRKEFSRKFNFERHKLTCHVASRVSSRVNNPIITMEIPKKI